MSKVNFFNFIIFILYFATAKNFILYNLEKYGQNQLLIFELQYNGTLSVWMFDGILLFWNNFFEFTLKKKPKWLIKKIDEKHSKWPERNWFWFLKMFKNVCGKFHNHIYLSTVWFDIVQPIANLIINEKNCISIYENRILHRCLAIFYACQTRKTCFQQFWTVSIFKTFANEKVQKIYRIILFQPHPCVVNKCICSQILIFHFKISDFHPDSNMNDPHHKY